MVARGLLKNNKTVPFIFCVFRDERIRVNRVVKQGWTLIFLIFSPHGSPQNLFSFADNWDVMAIEEKVKEILIVQLSVKPEQITPNARIVEDLGADSLDTIELVMAFEEEYGIEIPDEKAERLRTVGDVIKYLTETLKK